MKLLLTAANGFVGRYAQAALPCVPLPVAQVTDISVDYAVMEHADRVAVVPGDFGWL